ncbi:HAMP domain-containing protein [Candidatus Woesearchaeota archaeon]|nr:HAMP domain-containing protein [Candidatus Woesearchaeota archaeon]
MRLFWKIFFFVFISFILVIIVNSYVTLTREVSAEENHIIEENMIISRFISKELEVGYLESRWPFESLKQLSEREDFLFWWVVKDKGDIHLADDSSFIGTSAYEYFPEVSNVKEEYLSLDYKQEYGLFVMPIKMGRERWSFWLGFSLEKISEITRAVLFSVLWFSALAVAALGFLLYLIIGYFTRPIHKLVDGTKAVAGGNLDYRLKVKSGDELGQLSDSFNYMTKDLKKSRKELEKYSKGLEKEVKKRTKELESKNLELEKFNKIAVGREIRMVELKKRIKELESQIKK